MNSITSCFKPNKASSFYTTIRFATKKAGGSTKNGRDSPGQRLGVKKFGGEYVYPGNIIIRQRGKETHPGNNTKIGKDYTVYAVSEGFVKFEYKLRSNNKLQKHVAVVEENPNPPPYPTNNMSMFLNIQHVEPVATAEI